MAGNGDGYVVDEPVRCVYIGLSTFRGQRVCGGSERNRRVTDVGMAGHGRTGHVCKEKDFLFARLGMVALRENSVAIRRCNQNQCRQGNSNESRPHEVLLRTSGSARFSSGEAFTAIA